MTAAASDDEAPERPDALEAIGVSHVRVAALRELVRDGPASTAEIARRLEMPQDATRRQLGYLQAGGLVTSRRATHPRGLGGITYWEADTEAVLGLVDDLHDGLTT